MAQRSIGKPILTATLVCGTLDILFAVILTLLTLITGVIWAADKWWLGPRRRAAPPAAGPWGT